MSLLAKVNNALYKKYNPTPLRSVSRRLSSISSIKSRSRRTVKHRAATKLAAMWRAKKARQRVAKLLSYRNAWRKRVNTKKPWLKKRYKKGYF